LKKIDKFGDVLEINHIKEKKQIMYCEFKEVIIDEGIGKKLQLG
jgi:hypothetical protein